MSNIIGSTIQITTLPLPVLSTLQASGLVFNTAFATLLLKEPFTRYSIIGTVLTCSGAALIATFGAVGEPAHNLRQLLAFLKRRDFIIWMVGTLLVAVGTILFAHFLKLWSSHRHLEQHLVKTEQRRSSSISHVTGVKRSFTQTLPQALQVRVSRLRFIRGLAYGLISGILSAHSLLMAKSAVELIVRTVVDRNNQFNRFQSWLILLALLFFALAQLYYLHLGLRLCSTSVLYPFVFCVYNIIAILDGLIYFQQASRLTALDAGLVSLGTVILLTGVFALSWRLDDHATPEQEAQAAVPPAAPLTPGMGLVRSSDELDREPLLPTGRSRSSTSASRRSAHEQTPLLRSWHGSGSRRPSVNIHPPPPDDTRDIWAELDDEENDRDVLASLPHAPSPFLNQKGYKRRNRSFGESVSSVAVSSRRTSHGDSMPSSPILKTQSNEEQGHVGRKASGKSGRERSTSVRFAEDQKEAKTSRYDAGKQERSRSRDGKGDEPG